MGNGNRTEMKQNELEELYKTLAESSYTCVYILQDKKVQFINRHAAIYGGTKAEDVIGRVDSIRFVHPDDRAVARENAIKMLKGQRSTPYEFRCVALDGKIRWLIETVTPITFRGRPAVLANSMDISEMKEAKDKIEQFKNLASSILDATPHAILGLQERKIIFANGAVESVFGWPPKDLIGESARVLYRSDREYEMLGEKIYGILVNQRNFMEPEFPCQCRDGRIITCRINASRIGNRLQNRRIVATYEDITERKKADIALQERKKELENQTRHLEEINTALNVLLEKREKDKRKIEESITSNIKELIMPCLETLKRGKLDPGTRIFVDTVESAMQNITSPFLKTLSSNYVRLTPREVLVAGLLREGKATKEIANLLNTSVRGAEFHRENIRRKLGLKYKKENLVSYLRTLQLEV